MAARKDIKRLEDLTPDPKNANKHTQRGMGLLGKSLEAFGAGRSILATRDGVVLAGNATLEEAVAKGFKPKIIRTDGQELVVVVREDLDSKSKRARGLALADNRVAEVNLEWDSDVLKDEADIAKEFFYEHELDAMAEVGEDIAAAESGGDPEWDSFVFAEPDEDEVARIKAKDAAKAAGDPTVCPMCKRPFGPEK